MLSKITVFSFSLTAGIIATLTLLLAIDFLASYRAPAKEQRPLLVVDLATWPIPEQQQKKEKPSKPKPASLPQAEPQKKVTNKTPPLPEQKRPSLTKKNIPKKPLEPVKADPVQERTKTAVKAVKETPTRPTLPIPVPFFQLTQAPRFLHRETPVYPDNMRVKGASGIVKLEALIDKKGQVQKVNILQSAGEHFDEAAKRAIFASSFYPAKIKHEPVAVLLRLPVKFNLL